MAVGWSYKDRGVYYHGGGMVIQRQRCVLSCRCDGHTKTLVCTIMSVGWSYKYLGVYYPVGVMVIQRPWCVLPCLWDGHRSDELGRSCLTSP